MKKIISFHFTGHDKFPNELKMILLFQVCCVSAMYMIIGVTDNDAFC